jgi:heptosyltransferase II
MQSIDALRPNRFLLTRTDRIGDLLLTTPVFEALKAKFPNSFLAVLVLKGCEPVVKGNPWVDEVLVYDKKGREKSWFNSIKFGRAMRRHRFDVAIHLHATNRVNALSYLAGIPVRIGYKRKNDYLLTHRIPELKWQGARHEADYNFDLISLIGVPRPDRFKLYFPLVPDAAESIARLFSSVNNRNHVVFHPSASCPSKVWPPERFGRVADDLVRTTGICPVIIGEGAGVDRAREMEAAMKERAVNLAGQLDLAQLGWLLKSARYLISNDSGPVHIAAALNTPVISIFGRNQGGLSATRWRPIAERSTYLQKDVGCIQCLAHECPIHFKCLNELSVAEVLEEVKSRDLIST